VRGSSRAWERLAVLAPYLALSAFLLLMVGASAGLPVAVSVAAGGSMYPSVRSGDLAVLVSAGLAGVGKGDMAVYRSGGGLVLHRVADIRGGLVIFEGDNNVVTDNPVRVEDVLYRVVAVIPYEAWVPAASASLVLLGLAPQLLLWRRGRHSHSLHTYVALAAFMAVVLSFSALSPAGAGYTVKPVPMPAIERVALGPEGEFHVWLNIQPEEAACRGGRCSVAGNVLVVKPEGGTVWVSLRLPTGYNLTVEFALNFSAEGG